MSHKKLVLLGAIIIGLTLNTAVTTHAQNAYETGDITAILEDNSFRDVATRYMSVYSYFFPEEASRIGFTSDRNTLNDRSPETDAQALQAFEAIRNAMKEINKSRLSRSKIADYNLLKNALDNTIWQLGQNRLARDPLYYTQALDAVYDLLLFPQSDKRQEHRDVVGRVSALAKIAEQAKQNLTDASPELSRLAMEKAYYAYLSFDAIDKKIIEGASLDANSNENLEQVSKKAKAAIKSMFEFFKLLSKQEDTLLDFRMGKKPYQNWLKMQYQITDKPEVLERNLKRYFENSQKDLWNALRPFELSADLEEVTMVEDLNEIPQNASYAAPGKNPTKPSKKDDKPVYVPPTANQFYALAKQLHSPFQVSTLLDDITKQAATQATRLVRGKMLPTTMSFVTKPLPAYFAYRDLYLKLPALRALFLRIPTGNKLAQTEALDRDFNEPSSKILITRELVPGRYYQEYSISNSLRRTLGSPTMANGWKEYALRIAEKQGYFLTDEEQLFLAWHRYRLALSALLDQRLHSQQYTYDEALRFLTEEQGFPQEEALALLSESVAYPGRSVSYIVGDRVWQRYGEIYRKKLKDEGKLNVLLLQAGNVLPSDLKAELKRLYKQ